MINNKTEYQPGTDYRFKLMYALGMIIIVSGHCDGGGISLLYEWFPINAFELGLFAFCSGYFYKPSAEAAPGKYIAKKAKRLLIPLYAWNLVYGLIVLLLGLFGFTIGEEFSLYNLLIAPITDGHQFAYNLCSWFVVPLFLIECINVLLRKLAAFLCGSIKEHVFFFFYLLLGIAGVKLAMGGRNTGAWLVATRVMYLIAFYGLGIYYKSILEPKDTLPSRFYFLIIFALEAVIIFIYKKAPGYVPSWSLYADDPFIPFIAGFIAIAFWLRACRILSPVVGESKWVNAIADNTYAIMLHQFAGFMLVKAGFAFLNRFTPLCSDFSMELFKSDLWYFYVPGDLSRLKIIYLAAGIIVPIIIQKVCEKWKIKK